MDFELLFDFSLSMFIASCTEIAPNTMANEPHIYEWISCHLEHNEQRRVPFILGGLNTFIQS